MEKRLRSAAGATANLLLVARQHLVSATADGADAEQADENGFGFDIRSLRDMSLRRNAWCFDGVHSVWRLR